MITHDPQAPHNTLGYDAADMLERLRWRLRDELRYCTADGVLIKNAIVEDALAMRPQLLQLLLGNDPDDPLRRNFFAEVAGVQVFDKVRFQRFVMNKRFLADSYTAFKNKIGLTTDDEHFLADSHEVVLTWPYKDCILEGGQTKDDARRRETFWSEILAPDQITQLTAPKALTNFKRYSSDGVQTEGIQLRDDDNLIIKGNNLLALYSLCERYRGRIKLIYIDPPYNTGNDSFGYNDSFNHSTWLTFMKNRLTVARDLLAPDGVIFVSLDDNEAHYCKVLMDEIFREENFLNDVIWNSTKSVTNTALISVSHTHNLVYFKNKEYFIKNRTEFRLAENGEGFSNPDNDPRGVWKADPFQVGGWRPNQQYEIVNPKTGKSYFPNEGCSWKNDYKKFQELLADNRIVFGTTGDAGPQRKRFKFEAEERGRVAKTIWEDVGTTTNGTQHLKKMFGSMVFSNPKPESLIQRVIELSTEEGDIVLDYHLGSGTTAAVAHKMGRQYIGVEQMDYIEDIAVERLRKVIAGEQGGISKSVDWQGGGDFVYCELASANQAYIDKIQRAETEEKLLDLWEEMQQRAFLSYKVDPRDYSTLAKELTDLSLEGLRHFLIDVLDKNLLYVPLSELESSEYSNLCAEDRRLTHIFYHEP
ncbi:DNA methyltransferase [Porphyromonas sp.]|uniref:DNA methyltransferase n=1 Tax=Porphyromonas sp. TaxID=1924944 RepID=UPI003992CAE6